MLAMTWTKDSRGRLNSNWHYSPTVAGAAEGQYWTHPSPPPEAKPGLARATKRLFGFTSPSGADYGDPNAA